MTGYFAIRLARWSMFLVYVWFGALKLFNLSPANPLVAALLERTLPFVTFEQFIIALGVFEIIIGVLFVLPQYKRVLMVLFGVHMLMTTAPLVLLPAVAWQGWFVPTLEGQYMIKNSILIALALTIFTNRTAE